MAENFASAMHNADNPLNLANLLNTGLRIAEGRINPPPVPAPVQNSNATPGAAAPAPNPQVGESVPAMERFKAFLPVAIVIAVGIIVLGLIFRK